MLDLFSFFREVFSHLASVTSVKIQRSGVDYFVTVTVPAGADQRSIYGVLTDIRKRRPDLSVDVFVEEE